jgi:hypothetical protein
MKKNLGKGEGHCRVYTTDSIKNDVHLKARNNLRFHIPNKDDVMEEKTRHLRQFKLETLLIATTAFAIAFGLLKYGSTFGRLNWHFYFITAVACFVFLDAMLYRQTSRLSLRVAVLLILLAYAFSRSWYW